MVDVRQTGAVPLPLELGSEAIGRLAVKGRVPVGYYKDPERSQKTFPVIAGERYSISGDFPRFSPAGEIELLGRGSGCINTGGEKVFPEEIEETLKHHPLVIDAVVFGSPHERYGKQVCSVVRVKAQEAVSVEEIQQMVKTRLASYKAPRRIAFTTSSLRHANGKADYDTARTILARTYNTQ